MQTFWIFLPLFILVSLTYCYRIYHRAFSMVFAPKWENSILIYYFLFFFISIAVYSSRSKASNIGRDWDDFASSKCLFYYQHSQSYSKTSVLDPLHLDVKSHQPLSENLTELISCIPTILWATLSSLYFTKFSLEYIKLNLFKIMVCFFK